ncbi:HEAT repeat domain-containing protein [filamentous cyanobacterium LEGE 11480]|uniref:HEAT repeat domain-containing protein n=1 Tax=Romeriopsis navalis LEGE 11480 TaxID=2777977 RepID=A0A928VPZ5_9CYAN|nr:HEAT repeat domain-containing protein [Romeriopsis navalis]MBE9030776.1 HEAT repeat domain-containing protein [Romeriopsis navalis LEGE 11480]
MYSKDDLSVLDFEADLDSPLDPLDDLESEPQPKVDPEEMLPLLTSSDVQQRMIAARAFCELEDSRAIPALIQLLSDSCPLIRVSAAYALGRNTSADAVEPLIQQYATDWNGYVRKGVVWALGNCRDARAVPTLLGAIKTDIAAVRMWAASAMAQMGSIGYEQIIQTIPPLIEGLRGDLIAAVRSNCAWSVGELCRDLPANVVYATAVDSLIEAFAEDPDISVREDAKAAMLKLGDPRGLQVIEELEQEGWGL